LKEPLPYRQKTSGPVMLLPFVATADIDTSATISATC